MRLTVVGSAPAWTRRPGHASSCYLVEHGGQAIVLDMGQGSFAELARYRQPADVAAVVISHLHPDHFIDLVPLRHYLKYDARTAAGVAIHAPAELAKRLDALLDERGFLAQIAVTALEEGEFEAAGFTVEARRVTHIPNSFAFRVTVPSAASGLVYSGDCGVAQDLDELVRPGDVLLCEAAYGAADQAGQIHLNAAAAAGVAARTSAGRLILTHVLDGAEREAALAAARAVFSGDVALAEPDLKVDLS